MAKGTRRTPQQVHEVALKIHAGVEKGESIEALLKANDLSDSTYRRWLKDGGPKKVFVTRGSVAASSLPPRPKKGGKRTPRQVDMNDIASIAARIARIDR